MPKLFRHIAILLGLVLTLSATARLQASSEKLYNQLKLGNTYEMYSNLSEIVYIQIEGEKGAYSKKQAKALLDKFFKYNKPRDFKLQFDRYKEESSLKYSIGKLSTAKGDFSVFILLKINGSDYLIKQIRLEKL